MKPSVHHFPQIMYEWASRNAHPVPPVCVIKCWMCYCLVSHWTVSANSSQPWKRNFSHKTWFMVHTLVWWTPLSESNFAKKRDTNSTKQLVKKPWKLTFLAIRHSNSFCVSFVGFGGKQRECYAEKCCLETFGVTFTFALPMFAETAQ